MILSKLRGFFAPVPPYVAPESRHPIKQGFPPSLIIKGFSDAGYPLSAEEEGALRNAWRDWSGNERFYWRRLEPIDGGLNDCEIALPRSE